ncbi:MAG: glycosyltransferase family 39 protein [Nitrospirae bacterium]|nr:glycosyltransferase family 39 protein [Nitrospirota bacterium]
MARFFLPVAALALFLCLFRLGSVSLFDVDEAVFAEATKEMVQTGDWITPTYNGENRYDKPILFYLLMAGSYKTFGINELGARFPSALSAFLLCLAFFLFVARVRGGRAAMYASLPLILSPYFLVYSHAAVTDMALALFISLSLFSFYLSLERGRSVFLYGFYVFSALAFLTKGLIGILFPFGIAFVYLLIGEGLKGLKKVFSPPGILLFVVVSGPWYVAQLAINGQEFVQQFLIKHHFQRYTGVISGHRGPLYYYLPALIVGLLPWAGCLPSGIRNAFSGRKTFRTAGDPLREPDRESGTPQAPLDLFALVWFAFIFLFFSFSTTKLPNYILPAIPAAAILIASGAEVQDRWARYGNAGIAVITLAMGVAFLVSRKYLLNLGISDTGSLPLLALALFGLGILLVYSSFTRKAVYGPLAALSATLLIMLAAAALPAANAVLQATLYQYSMYAKQRLGPGERVITCGINNPSIVFYSDHRIVRVGNTAELLPLLETGRRALVITRAKEIEKLRKLGFNVVGEDRQYALLEKG